MTAQHVDTARQERLDAEFDRRLALARRHGLHVWIAVMGFYVNVPLEPEQLIDAENIAIPAKVGCYVCEKPYSPLETGRRCKGKPS